MKIGSMCSGYAGLDMAVEQVFSGASPAWFCEYDNAPAHILAHRYPSVPNHVDLTDVEWSQVEQVDVVTAGYPCQPFSTTGLRKGTADERHLWPYIREAVRVLRPRFVFLENVAGHRSLGFDRVLGDMAEDGMHVWWTSVRASDIGAPHHRERLFILATPSDAEGVRTQGCGLRSGTRQELPEPCSGDVSLSDAPSVGLEAREQPGGQPAQIAEHHSGRHLLPDADGIRRNGWRNAPLAAAGANGAADRHSSVDWGRYGPAVRRWELTLGRPAPNPTEAGRNGRPRLNAAFAEWMMGIPADHVTGVDIPRAAQLKAIGNGVCPQQAAFALQQLLDLRLSDLSHSWKVAA